MRKERWRSVVYTELLHKQNGFTLISSLLRIIIIATTLPILIFILSNFKLDSAEESLSIQQLFFMLQNEINLAQDVTLANSRLYLDVDDNIIVIEQYGALLRRRVNGQGHEVYHRDVGSMTLEQLPYGKKIKLKMLTGESYERILLTNN